jgi:hypothetical protein
MMTATATDFRTNFRDRRKPMTLTFQKATKAKVKARVAIDGPSGAGKTYSALILATVLANGGKIAVIDTERGSASLYSDKFNFDVLELDTFSPALYTQAIGAAEQAGYDVIVIDSLSHAWEGEGGALDMVDQKSIQVKGNSYVAWKDVTPLQRRMVDAMLQSPAHIIVTMRSKMDYIQETDAQGKKTVRKVGMAPIQRAGMEYEFTIVADMDVDHHISISKSRCDEMADKVAMKPGPDFWKQFTEWLSTGEERKPVTQTSQPASAPESDLREMTLLEAMDIRASNGKQYGERTTEELTFVFNNHKTPADKREAARLILADRASK